MERVESEHRVAALVRQALRQVVDPELGVNIVDLGLIYNVTVHDHNIRISMTMTTPDCPLEELLTTQVRAVIMQQIPTVRLVEIEVVWDPPWQPERMSEAAKAELGWSTT